VSIALKDIYRIAVEKGIAADARDTRRDRPGAE
jgi:hypothetical protein